MDRVIMWFTIMVIAFFANVALDVSAEGASSHPKGGVESMLLGNLMTPAISNY